MKTGYIFLREDNQEALTNLPTYCGECPSVCKSSNEVHQCDHIEEKRRIGIAHIKEGTLFLCTSEAVKSSSIFRHKLNIAKEFFSFLLNHKAILSSSLGLSVRRVVHNLVTLNGESLQAIYSTIPQENFSQPNRDQLVEQITRKVQTDPKSVALMLIDLVKNESLVKAEFSVYSKLFENEPPNRRPYGIHKILMLILNTFWDDFKDLGIWFEIGNSYEKVFADYDSLAASFVHIFQNSTKYILPHSTMSIRFSVDGNRIKVILDMISLRVEPNEILSIFNEGYSGINTKLLGKAGDGLGLNLVKRLLELSDGKICFHRDQNTQSRRLYNGLQYENNIFEFDLPLFSGLTSASS
jgi:hypothetical protein